MIARTALFTTFGLALCVFAACGPSPIKRSLEVTALRYDTTNLTECGGDLKNISHQPINDLQVQVEFQNADGNRVRIATGMRSPTSLVERGRQFFCPLREGIERPTGCSLSSD